MKALSTLCVALLLLLAGQSPAPPPQAGGKAPPAGKGKVAEPGQKKPATGTKGESPSFPGLPPRRQQRAAAPDPLPGVWRLRRISGQPPAAQVRGYVLFTRLYASFHIMVQVPRQRPVHQSGLWRYRRRGDRLDFTRIIETGRHPGGSAERRKRGPEPKQVRRIRIVGNTLQIARPDGKVMDLVRLE